MDEIKIIKDDNVPYKMCTKCQINLELVHFNKDSQKKDGLDSHCKKCRKKYKDKYNTKNKNKINQKSREYRKLNKETIKKSKRQWYLNNKNHHYKKTLEWRRNNRDKANRYNSLRRAQKLKSAVHLDHMNLALIEHIYWWAKQSEKDTGIKYHVDHIIPLNGNGVCGLHVPWNLQILTAEENMRKNKYYETENNS